MEQDYSFEKPINDNTLIYRCTLCSNMYDFRAGYKYVDLIIKCEDVRFGCHRIVLATASKFFDTELSSQESTNGYIIFPLPPGTLSAKTFKDILQFIYTGDVEITSDNALDILEAGEFFKLPDIEKFVTQFITENQMSVKNTLDLFIFACKTEKKKFISCLRDDIARNLEISSRMEMFFEVPFEHLYVILIRYSVLWDRYDDVLLGAITRWINHDRENRYQYFAKFCKIIKDLNSEWMRYAINLFASGPDSLSSNESVKSLEFYETPEKPRKVVTENLMYIYVRYAEEKLMRVFSMNNDDECSFSCETPLFQSNQWMKCIASNGYLYSLHYVRNRDIDYFEPSTCKQSFRVSISTNVCSPLCLKEPPVIFGDVSMCSIQNEIYAYNQTLSQCTPTSSTLNSGMFTIEELNHGLYVYNRELDKWFPVPTMLKKLQNSCMTSIGNRLFLIGGEPVDNSDYKNFVQAYDHRAGVWNVLPTTANNYVGADCCGCEDNGMVYVCGGREVTPAFEEYNPKAGRWVELEPPPTQKEYHRLTYSSLTGKFYAMCGTDGDLSIQMFKNKYARCRVAVDLSSPVSTIFSVESGDEDEMSRNAGYLWTNSSKLAEKAKETTGGSTTGVILDSVIFKGV